MGALTYSLAQIEAFACIAEHGSITKAAAHLGKDRSTVSELLEFFEIELGFALFARSGRSLSLTSEGERLQRQARLLLRQAQAFGAAAKGVPSGIADAIRIAYDPFVPRTLLHALIDDLAASGIDVSTWSASRDEAEAALVSGAAQVAISLARNRFVAAELEWRAVGAIEIGFYASADLFPANGLPVTVPALAARPQVVMHRSLGTQFAQLLQVSDRLVYANELETVRHLLQHGHGWGFLPTHFDAGRWPSVTRIDTEVGHGSLVHSIVAVWKPGTWNPSPILEAIDAAGAAWEKAAQRQHGAR
ncbi:LysR family transcriptional regulator [Burkholderia cenocepacia]|uniref:LysR family transcriptional regulator n=1 Tax=Burkholderia cenocepacia TaxID=95486 RepID=A0A1V2WA94_9BURK|nr:LysR family transcriptional regulator [Burkholderia cenocepacia]MBR8247424.1 LysR family transcriptional regulator [Burkholderia cenocepacia]MBR8289936.1 LysR family transcriptional regulator [Burkholderia cenocepacia]MBR8500762.1 LysR family transcriptional regulator [Burkholderia cenocepacia]ONJ03667.1 LysR family transcriptional regulator [Burkholderia cenocepacia]ONJ23397.1 LysR family transcriptional regulator [Burkholderia cenocepacia]